MTDEQIDTTVKPSSNGCIDCEASGSWWVHLRRCTACGHVGCCDDSPSRHATAHWESTGHRYIQSFEPGEDWWWDYQEQATIEGPELAPPTSRPESQPSPGPEGRVPEDWRRHLATRARAD